MSEPFYVGPAPPDWPASVAGCPDCGGPHEAGDWACPKLTPAPLGGRGDWHHCLTPTNPACQGECGGGGW